MSRRQITQRQESSLPSGSDWHSQSLHVVRLDVDLKAASRFMTPVSCEIAEPPRCWTCEHFHGPLAGLPMDSLADWQGAELVDQIDLIAGLVFHQVRRGNRKAAHAPNRNSSDAKLGSVLVVATDTGS